MRNLLMLFWPAFLTASSAWHAIRADSLGQKRAHYLFKPLTTLLIIAYACLGVESLQDRRGLLVIAGLIFSLFGDAFLMFPKRFAFGLASFLVAHLLYIAAFFTGSSLTGLAFMALPLAIYAVVVIAFLWRQLGQLKLAVLLYLLIIIAMVYQAGERYLALSDLATLLALIGALLFALSDTLLAFNKFKTPLLYISFWVLSTYYSAQWLIALSLHLRFR